MSTKADYTQDQWQLLLDVPPLVGTAVMVAGRSGLGSVKEALAVASGVLDAKHGYESNELIKALLDARIIDKERSHLEQFSEQSLSRQTTRGDQGNDRRKMPRGRGLTRTKVHA